MKDKYWLYFAAGVAVAFVYQDYLSKNGVDTTVKRPEQDTAASWWEFWK